MERDIYAHIGSRIREERIKRKFTIQDLAEAADTSPSFVTYIELGKKKASVETFRKIAEGLGVPLKSLFSATGSSEASAKYFSNVDLLLKGKNPRDRDLILKMVKILSKELGRR